MNIPITIEFSDWQRSVYAAMDKYRFIVISAGRQSGKTFFCVAVIVLHALINKDSVCWWVAPVYDISRIAFRRAIAFCQHFNIPHKTNKSELCIKFANGSTIWFKSADKEDSLRGESVNFMVIDEMGVIKRQSWEYALRGTITATKASVIFIGTPKGKNLFYDLYIMGQDKENTDYISFQFASNESPFFGAEEWESVKRLPQRIFEQEYQAKFIDDGGEVFRGITDCISGDLEPYHPGKSYFAGVDLAKSYDYTVITILDHHGHLCAFDRFNDISWTVQKQRIIDLCSKYDAMVVLDSTGLGDPILDDLSPHIRVTGFKFSNISKRQIIESLAMSIERREITFPEIPELINELSIFTFEQTSGGLIRYSAPEGLHDDIVISLALAHHGYYGNRGTGDMIIEVGNRTTSSGYW